MGEIRDFEDGEFYGFRTDFERKKEEIQEEISKEIENKEYIMETYEGGKLKNIRKQE